MSPALRRPLLLVALLLTIAGAAAYERIASRGDAALTAAPRPAPAAVQAAPPVQTPEELAERARNDSLEREQVEQTVREWLGDERWAVSVGYKSLEMLEVQLVDSSAAELRHAFVTLPSAADPKRGIELLGAGPAGRAVLDGPLDSLARAAALDRWRGCPVALALPFRRTAGDGEWRTGWVPGMVRPAARAVAAEARHGAEAARLFATLDDSNVHAPLDSFAGRPWTTSIAAWQEGAVEVLVASRRRTSGPDEYGRYVHEQVVVAERATGTDGPFTIVLPWNATYEDDPRSMWVETALRVGPSARFALLLGRRGKEGGGGSLFIRTPAGWRDAVEWWGGC